MDTNKNVQNDSNKADKLENTYNNDRQMWAAVKNLTNTNKNQPPRMIINNGDKVTSLKKISSIANEHFINKINKIREGFSPPNISFRDT